MSRDTDQTRMEVDTHVAELGTETGAPPRELSLSDPALGEEEILALRAVIDSGWITMGEQVRRLEESFAQAHGIPEAIAVGSGTAALHLGLAALGIGPGDEVLVPSLSFVASVNAILYVGARPVLVDIESPSRPHLSLSDAQSRLTPRTKAVLLVHYGGWLCPMDLWRGFADGQGLFIVEDAAHAPGLPGVALQGDTAAFSFYGNKNMTTAEGGMVTARDPEVAARLRRLRSHGMTTLTLDRFAGHAYSYDVTALGFNYRMDELRAAVGRVQLARLAERNARRAALLGRYRDRFTQGGQGIEIPFHPEADTVAHLCPALLPAGTDRERVMRGLRESGIHSSIHYPPIHRFSFHAERLGTQRLPHTEGFAARELSLPLHPGLGPRDVDRVAERLQGLLG